MLEKEEKLENISVNLILTFISLIVVSLSVFASDKINPEFKEYFTDDKCDQILYNKGYFVTCYSYKNKGPLYVTYTLRSKKVNSKNIKERDRFYEDENIPYNYID